MRVEDFERLLKARIEAIKEGETERAKTLESILIKMLEDDKRERTKRLTRYLKCRHILGMIIKESR